MRLPPKQPPNPANNPPGQVGQVGQQSHKGVPPPKKFSPAHAKAMANRFHKVFHTLHPHMRSGLTSYQRTSHQGPGSSPEGLKNLRSGVRAWQQGYLKDGEEGAQGALLDHLKKLDQAFVEKPEEDEQQQLNPASIEENQTGQ